MQEQFPGGALPGGGCSVDVLRIFGSLSVRGCHFNKVAKWLLLRLRFCIVVLLWVCFMFAEHLSWRATLEDCF